MTRTWKRDPEPAHRTRHLVDWEAEDWPETRSGEPTGSLATPEDGPHAASAPHPSATVAGTTTWDRWWAMREIDRRVGM